LEFWRTLWQEHNPGTAPAEALECFLCGDPSPEDVFSSVLPDYTNPARRLIVPFDAKCHDLDPMRRMGRAIRMLQAMHKARTGKRLQFTQVAGQARWPRLL
jgi:hypothetical protein